jgi:DNA-binding transcriptional LysR family regulator
VTSTSRRGAFGTNDDRVEGDFAVGTPPEVGQAFGPRFILSMRERASGIRLRIVEGNTGSLQDWLLRAVIDFALLEEPAPDARLAYRCVLQQSLMLIQQHA